MKIDFSKLDSIKEFIKNTESGLYEGINEDNETVVVGVDKGDGFSVRTEQSNGWWRISEYDKDGIMISESFSK